MKRVVSVSLGTSRRDVKITVNWLGEEFQLERTGTDGDLKRFEETFKALDGKVAALGIGGADLTLQLGERKYTFTQIAKIVRQVKTTPVVDGSGLKHTLERQTIQRLQDSGAFDFRGKTALMVAAVDRFGMAMALEQAGAKMLYGDLMFGLGINVPLRTYRQVTKLGKMIVPIVTRLPIQWFYPTGKQQEERKPKFEKAFAAADVIAGDWHYIRRYMPDDLKGKSIITQTVRPEDLTLLKRLGLEQLITTTPDLGGQTLATNVMEALIVAHLGRTPDQLRDVDYEETLQRLGWQPNVIALNRANAAAVR